MKFQVQKWLFQEKEEKSVSRTICMFFAYSLEGMTPRILVSLLTAETRFKMSSANSICEESAPDFAMSLNLEADAAAGSP